MWDDGVGNCSCDLNLFAIGGNNAGRADELCTARISANRKHDKLHLVL